MPVKLSVNVNKVATLRNSRGGREPDVIAAVRTCVLAGAPGITIHPREDQRHITAADVETIAAFLAPERELVEFNIEGDPRPALVERVLAIRPHQFTVVPVLPGELTSQAGWPADTPRATLASIIDACRAAGIRTSLFVDPTEEAVRWAASMGADRVELYTEPYARAFERGEGHVSFQRYVEAAHLAHELGLGVNAGHDLDLHNLPLFRSLPFLDEVSIGHALMSRALFVGLATVVREYLDVLRQDSSATRVD